MQKQNKIKIIVFVCHRKHKNLFLYSEIGQKCMYALDFNNQSSTNAMQNILFYVCIQENIICFLLANITNWCNESYELNWMSIFAIICKKCSSIIIFVYILVMKIVLHEIYLDNNSSILQLFVTASSLLRFSYITLRFEYRLIYSQNLNELLM